MPVITTIATITTTIRPHGVELVEVVVDAAVVGGVVAAVGWGVEPVPRVGSRGGRVSRGVVTVAGGSLVASVCACRAPIGGAAPARRPVIEMSTSREPAATLTTFAVVQLI
jgi:hypothetical protein